MIIIQPSKQKMWSSAHVYAKGDHTKLNTPLGPPYIKVECSCGLLFDFYFNVKKKPHKQVVRCPGCTCCQDMATVFRNRRDAYEDHKDREADQKKQLGVERPATEDAEP